MDASETAQEFHKVRQRIHDLAEIGHQHGNKIEISNIKIANLEDTVEGIVNKSATREQLASESNLLKVQLNQLSTDVSGIKGDINKVIWAVVLAVGAALLSTVLR